MDSEDYRGFKNPVVLQRSRLFRGQKDLVCFTRLCI